MKKVMLKKLKSRAGETLVETLFAILIATFASILLAGATTTAMELNRQARERDTRNQKCMSILSGTAGDASDGKVKVILFNQPETPEDEKTVKDTKEIAVSYTDCNISDEETEIQYGDYSTYILCPES